MALHPPSVAFYLSELYSSIGTYTQIIEDIGMIIDTIEEWPEDVVQSNSSV